jgi:hypothetical protein
VPEVDQGDPKGQSLLTRDQLVIPVVYTKQPAAVALLIATWATATAPPTDKALQRVGLHRLAILRGSTRETWRIALVVCPFCEGTTRRSP